MNLVLPAEIQAQIHAHGEAAYPEEGAGLLLGADAGEERRVAEILALINAREAEARGRRYLIAPQEFLRAEEHASRRGLEVVGIFHSHPDHPSRPSEYDREWGLPWYSYLITSVRAGQAVESRSWRLADDRSAFVEETILIQY